MVITFERKSMPMVAWYMLSKESYMKRVIKEVLPTAGSQIRFSDHIVLGFFNLGTYHSVHPRTPA